MDNNRWSNIESLLTHYANSQVTSKYSIAHFRVINNILDEEWNYLKEHFPTLISLIETKYKMNLEVRLLDPEIKASEVTAIKLLLDELKNDETSSNDNVVINLNFQSEYVEGDAEPVNMNDEDEDEEE